MFLIATDWSPVIVALSGAIPILAIAIANYLKTAANGRKIEATHREVNGGLGDVRTRLAALERLSAETPTGVRKGKANDHPAGNTGSGPGPAPTN